jgi:hypothetical protein
MPGPKPSCLCGSCAKCRDRAAHRERYRADPQKILEQNRASAERRLGSKTDEQMDAEALAWLKGIA